LMPVPPGGAEGTAVSHVCAQPDKVSAVRRARKGRIGSIQPDKKTNRATSNGGLG
jgi:hypothetical protein